MASSIGDEGALAGYALVVRPEQRTRHLIAPAPEERLCLNPGCRWLSVGKDAGAWWFAFDGLAVAYGILSLVALVGLN